MSKIFPLNFSSQKTLKNTTKGRRTGQAHTIEVWFGVDKKGRIFVSSVKDRDWVKNILVNPEVLVTIKDVRVRMKGVEVKSIEENEFTKKLWKKKYGLMAMIMKMPRKDGVSFKLKELEYND
ncbi:MAG: nitroreductase/quinone reductase family protein [Thaumarchaeota archaeon]|jgi:hypothetical protein|nr:nitroreductase/quinone reductase family protein [Candidatus Geocrenenecus arthurdayi]MCL7389644.1 nitroreductase/quinone reductase family protein [Candidatus Geocrenenecus arthurdayi]MCL7391091.1 nitroreductase/quinone reductase family protein [Candidatus Geocrenenecus arthurdayi]MCL7396927.1 nitroreductase/quinone reductase family protein [Candidatus Geocrenenecus arthurdayi]MCL7403467.1 nitroreductase/quinone reductase family protein [Candidatus Geocrenenecus arthurdayi]